MRTLASFGLLVVLACGPSVAVGGGGSSDDGEPSTDGAGHSTVASGSSVGDTGSGGVTSVDTTGCDADCDVPTIHECADPPGISVTSVSVESAVSRIVRVDLDGDPLTQPAVVTMSGGAFEARLPTIDLGVFASSPNPVSTWDVRAFDLGDDAFGDLVGITSSQHYAYVYEGDGGGGFSLVGPGLQPASGRIEDLAVADFDADGHDDIAVMSNAGDGDADAVAIAFGTGDGVAPVLAPPSATFSGASMHGLALTAHASGVPRDLAVVRVLEQDVVSLANDGQGSFTAIPGAQVASIPRALAAVRRNGIDGVIAIANDGQASQVLVWTGASLDQVDTWALPSVDATSVRRVEQLDLGLGNEVVFTTEGQLHIVFDFDGSPCIATYQTGASGMFAAADVDPSPGLELLLPDASPSILVVDLAQ